MLPSADKTNGGLVGWFVRNPVAANLLMALLLIGGILTASSIRAQVFPTISPGVVNVNVPYPGATPAEVEQGITRRVEEAIIGIDGVKSVTSSAQENNGSITVELADFADPELVKDDVEAAVDRLTEFPPENAERAIVSIPSVTETVVSLVVMGAVPPEELRRSAEALERYLLNQPGVSLVSLSGVRDYEISIEVSEDTLRRYNLTFDEVATAVRASSLDLAGGSINTDGGEILLRTNQERQTGEAFESIVVRTDTDGSQILLSDVATVRDGFARQKLRNTYNGRPAVFVDVSAAEAQGSLDVKSLVDDAVATYTPPAGIEIAEFKDQTFVLSERISLLARNALFGFALVFFFLVLMVDLKLAVWVSVGIAIAFIGSFIIFGSLGVTITMVSTFALIVVLGIVVDDAVVIGENIDTERALGKNGEQAAIDGVLGVMAPVVVGVLTSVFAFAPLIFLDGTFADVTRAIPIVVISVLFISLVEAFLILPSHLGHAGNWSRGPLAAIQEKVANGVSWVANTVVARAVRLTSKWRYATLGSVVAFTLFCVGLLGNGVVKFIFFPTIESNELSATVTLPEGTPFSRTDATTKQLADAISRVATRAKEEQNEELVRSIAMTVGGGASTSSAPGPDGGFEPQENVGQVQIELVPFGGRQRSAQEIERAWREEIGQLDGIERLSFSTGGAGFGADVGFDLAHEDEGQLIAASDALKRAIAQVPGANQITDSFDVGKRQLVFELTPAGLAAGLTPADVARQVRQAFFGEEVQRIQRGREEVLVYVRYPDQARQSLLALDEFRVRLPDGASVPLNTVAEATESRAYSVIERVDGRRVVTVEAAIDSKLNTPGNANADLIARVVPELEKAYPGLVIVQSGDTRERSEEMAAMAQSFFIVVIVIFAVVATQLRSYLQPLAILIAIPIAVSGALLGHLVLGYAVSFVSIFGIIALAGVSINASVVLLDLYNKQRRAGVPSVEAATRASVRRFRPVLLTTLTTALGLAPLLMETSPQAQFLMPMAVSLGFGIVISGFMVVLVTPAVALIIEDIQLLPQRIRSLMSGSQGAASAPVSAE